jgi:rfaE bifunctional protein nucleotidyltransferase chain/domain
MNHQQILHDKIFTLDTLLAEVKQWKSLGNKIVFTNGCFDILHRGHVDYLNKASDLGDKLIVALNSDASMRKLKGPHRPIQDEQSRLHIMASLECVSAVFLFNEETPMEVLSKIVPDILVKGADYTIETIVGADIVLKNGGEVKTIDFLEGYSTSLIERKIKES